MRVLHVAKFPPGTPGGIERFVDELAAAQRRQGLDVAVLACSDSRSDTQPPPRDYPVYLARSLGQLLYLPVAPAFPLTLSRALGEFRPDVLHIQWPNPLAFALLASRAARRRRWILQWQADIDVEGGPRAVALPYRALAGLERRMLRRASCVLASSQAYADASPALQAFRERVAVVPLGIPLDAPPADAGTVLDWPPGTELRVVAVARLVAYKGLELLVEAARRTPGVAAVIIGSGPEANRIAAAAGELVAAGRVRLLGHVDDPGVQAWLQACDVFCLPSVNRLEAFGMTLLEAARAGKPAIATRVAGAGMPEVIAALGAGYLAEPGDPESLAAALREALHDKAMGNLQGPGREALAQFDIEDVARRIAAVYEGD